MQAREEIRAEMYELARRLWVEGNDIALASEIINVLRRSENNETAVRSARSNRLEPVER
jgi:hypothetical protein